MEPGVKIRKIFLLVPQGDIPVMSAGYNTVCLLGRPCHPRKTLEDEFSNIMSMVNTSKHVKFKGMAH